VYITLREAYREGYPGVHTPQGGIQGDIPVYIPLREAYRELYTVYIPLREAYREVYRVHTPQGG